MQAKLVYNIAAHQVTFGLQCYILHYITSYGNLGCQSLITHFSHLAICTFNPHFYAAVGQLSCLCADMKNTDLFHTYASQWIIISQKPQINISS